MPSSSSSLQIISKSTIYPETKSTLKSLKLSLSDLPMLSCQYIQKGVLLSQPPFDTTSLLSLLKHSLAKTLSHFPPLAGRFHTDEDGYIHVLCNDAGVEFYHAQATHLSAVALLATPHLDLPQSFREFFQFNDTLSYAGHYKPLVAVQVTELSDGVFIGCTVNHSIVDGTSFWNFFNTFAELSRGDTISKPPVFTRETVFNSPAVLKLPKGGPAATFSGNDPIREKIFHFSRESIFKLKCRANKVSNGVFKKDPTAEISSFQSLSAQLWRSVTRARNFPAEKKTTFRMAVNCRTRLDPKLADLYFGNAIQSIPTVATVGDLLSEDLNWAADLLHRKVVAHDDGTVRRGIQDWESSPRVFPLGNFDGAMITMGSSPRFPMYDNDFGWGRPLAVRSGKANKFDGKISAFPGREGNGSVDLEVVLAPETMAGLENDYEFMRSSFITQCLSLYT